MTGSNTRHFAYIDSIRGYAVALVILCHASYLVPNLPYPIHRLTVLGWHGVQLFFLASTVTLMMSYEGEVRKRGHPDIVAFFLRRFFRIAPAYYLAAVFYAFFNPPISGFNFGQALASVTFVNAWSPHWMGVTQKDWNVVPGSWSIGVEFSFYAAFPVIAPYITSLRRAGVLVCITVIVAAVLNPIAWQSMHESLGDASTSNYLYYWFPSQASVFALGFCIFHGIKLSAKLNTLSGRWANIVASFGILLFASTSFVPLGQWVSWNSPWPPTPLYASLGLSIFVLAISQAPRTPFVNPVVSLLGRISFSAYLSHFAVLELIGRSALAHRFLSAEGYAAIAALSALILFVYPVVAAISWAMYRLIEIPMINLGRTLIAFRRDTPARATA